MFRLSDAIRSCPQATQIRQPTPLTAPFIFIYVILYKILRTYAFIHFITTLYFNTLICVIPVVCINYLKESNRQNTTCLEIDGLFYN
jgi:hypothetical protein